MFPISIDCFEAEIHVSNLLIIQLLQRMFRISVEFTNFVKGQSGPGRERRENKASMVCLFILKIILGIRDSKFILFFVIVFGFLPRRYYDSDLVCWSSE